MIYLVKVLNGRGVEVERTAVLAADPAEAVDSMSREYPGADSIVFEPVRQEYEARVEKDEDWEPYVPEEDEDVDLLALVDLPVGGVLDLAYSDVRRVR